MWWEYYLEEHINSNLPSSHYAVGVFYLLTYKVMKTTTLENWSLLLKDLCNLYIKQRDIEYSINDLFKWDIDITNNLSDIILDLFNFPRDNTLECFNFEKQKYIEWKNENDMYCRDYLYDILFDSKTWEELYNKLLEEKKLNNKYWMTLITLK